MAFALFLTATASKALDKLERKDRVLKQKVELALSPLELDPTYPGLRSHPFLTLRGANDEPIWESTVTQAGAAWRIWWHYGASPRGTEEPSITVVAIGKHP